MLRSRPKARRTRSISSTNGRTPTCGPPADHYCPNRPETHATRLTGFRLRDERPWLPSSQVMPQCVASLRSGIVHQPAVHHYIRLAVLDRFPSSENALANEAASLCHVLRCFVVDVRDELDSDDVELLEAAEGIVLRPFKISDGWYHLGHGPSLPCSGLGDPPPGRPFRSQG